MTMTITHDVENFEDLFDQRAIKEKRARRRKALEARERRLHRKLEHECEVFSFENAKRGLESVRLGASLAGGVPRVGKFRRNRSGFDYRGGVKHAA